VTLTGSTAIQNYWRYAPSASPWTTAQMSATSPTARYVKANLISCVVLSLPAEAPRIAVRSPHRPHIYGAPSTTSCTTLARRYP
jgi:hypothetical protein